MSYTVPAFIAAHTGVMEALPGGALAILDADAVELASATLGTPAGTVSGTTGQLAFTIATQEDSAPATGTAATAELRDSAGVVYKSFPCTEGTSAVSGECVLNSLSILQGAPVEVVSLVIG